MYYLVKRHEYLGHMNMLVIRPLITALQVSILKEHSD